MNFILFFLVAVAFALIHCMISGTRLLFSIPSYGLLALAGVLTLGVIRRVRTIPDFHCLAATAILSGYVLLRSLFSEWPFLGGDDFYMVIGCLLLYLLVAFYLTDSRWRMMIVAVLLALALADVIVGLIQFKSGKPFMLFGFVRDERHRASGMFISPDHLAGYLEVVAVMAVSIVCWARLKPALLLLIGWAALCCYVGIAVSGSRGGYLSTLVSLTTFAVLSAIASRNAGRARAILVTIAAVLAIAAVCAIAIPLMARNNLLGSRLATVATDNVRKHTWAAALDQFRVNPIVGTGSGTSLYYQRLFRRDQVQADPVHAHSDYLEFLGEYGILGVAAMVLFLAVHSIHGLRTTKWLAQNRLRNSAEGRSTSFALQVGALSGIAAYLLHSTVDFNMHIPGNALLLTFLFGMQANPDAEKDVETSKMKATAPWFRFVLPVVGLLFLGCGGIQSILYTRAGLSLSAGGPWTAAMVLPRVPREYWNEQTRVALRDQEMVKCVELAKRAIAFDQVAGINRRINPEDPAPYFYEGEANRRLALRMKTSFSSALYLKKAVASYQKGLEIFPEEENLLVRLAQSFDALNMFDAAEVEFQKAFKADPNLGIIHAYYGAHLRKLGLLKKSQEEYEKAGRVSDRNISKVGRQELGEP